MVLIVRRYIGRFYGKSIYSHYEGILPNECLIGKHRIFPLGSRNRFFSTKITLKEDEMFQYRYTTIVCLSLRPFCVAIHTASNETS